MDNPDDRNITLLQKYLETRTISITDKQLLYYLYNYDDLCYLTGISDRLPKKYISQAVIKNYLGINQCNEEIGIRIFDMGFSFVENGVLLGKNTSCRRLDFLRWIFKIKMTENSNYEIVGIKLWLLFILFILLLGILLIINKRNDLKLDRLFHLFKKTKNKYSYT